MNRERILKTATLSLAGNGIYALFNGAAGIAGLSPWFVTLSVYYMILSVMRFAVLKTEGKEDLRFAQSFVGWMLILLTLPLGGTALLSFVSDRGTKLHEILMITVALYTFTKATLAVINLLKAKKQDSPRIKTLRCISFADAAVSLFTLQRSMLVSFPGMSMEETRLFNVITGTGVCVLVLVMGIYLLTERRRTMAKSKLAKVNEKIAEGVVKGYKKIEDAAVGGYTKIEDKFVDMYLTRDGETVQEAKKRLKKKK